MTEFYRTFLAAAGLLFAILFVVFVLAA